MRRHFLAIGLAIGLGGLAFAGGPAFEDVDGDSDGKISRQEVAKVEGIDFAKGDTNEDGWLSRSEYTTASQAAASGSQSAGRSATQGAGRAPGGAGSGANTFPGQPMR